MRTIIYIQKKFYLNNKNGGGFTLIELLVVISIIALLSSIVLASLNDVRRKARNTQVQQEVGQWLKAIELYKADNGGKYPLTDEWNSMGFVVCLGGTHNSCQNNISGSLFRDNNSFKDSLREYIDVSQNPNRNPVPFNSFSRISYYSVYIEGGSDIGYSGNYHISITWFLEGNDWSCGYGGSKLPSGTAFYCDLVLYRGFNPAWYSPE
jgi:prepilin-type N-terminal cleavage/methylation domain-containing protein